jgi:creatine kinase
LIKFNIYFHYFNLFNIYLFFKLFFSSGCINVNSGIGVYAGSASSYTIFAPLFDRIIEDYHGHKPNDSHVTDWDTNKIPSEPLDPTG